MFTASDVFAVAAKPLTAIEMQACKKAQGFCLHFASFISANPLLFTE